MKDKDLNNILQKMEIPEHDEARKRTAIRSALNEFHRQKQCLQENRKGIKTGQRLTGKLHTFLTFIGGFLMKKQFARAGSVTVFVGVILFGTLHYMMYKKDLSEQMPVSKITGEPPILHDLQLNRKAKESPRENEELFSKDFAANIIQGGKVEHENDSLMYDLKKKPDSLPGEMYRNAALANRNQGTLEMQAGRPAAAPPLPVEISPYEYKETGRDQFEKFSPNPVKRVSEEPVSTFSIDVDTASYAFTRRQLNQGVLPQKNAVRIEEMINYFDYDYPVPADRSKPFLPTVAIYPAPWNTETKILHIGIQGYDMVPEQKPVSNLVFLIDVSGSMNSHDKLPLLKNSFRMLVDSLGEEDTIAIVVYAGAAGTVLEPTKVKDKGKILAALEQLQAGGSTAGGAGIKRAYELAEANFNKDGVNRVILATDGDFNVGIRNHEELKSFIGRKRETGIFLSVLGFGQGNYNDALMQKLAQNGNGNAAYIDNLNEARKVLVDEASSTLFPIAKDVKIQIEFNPKLIAEYRLIGYESRLLNREDFNNDKVDAGDIGSGCSVTALYEITPMSSKSRFIDDLRYSDSESKETTSDSFETEYAFLKIRYKLPDSERSKLITTPVTTKSEYARLEQVQENLRYAAAVAAFGQILRGGAYTGNFTYDQVIQLAESAVGKDTFGYKHEFMNLVRLAKTIK